MTGRSKIAIERDNMANRTYMLQTSRDFFMDERRQAVGNWQWATTKRKRSHLHALKFQGMEWGRGCGEESKTAVKE